MAKILENFKGCGERKDTVLGIKMKKVDTSHMAIYKSAKNGWLFKVSLMARSRHSAED